MIRLALLVLACAVLAPDAAAARKANRLKPVVVAEPERKTVRTILFDSKWKPHPTFEQRWAGEGK